MSLNKKQWAGVGAVITGLAVLPIVGAEIWTNNRPASNTNYIQNVKTGETTVIYATTPTVSSYNNAAQGPAARNNPQRAAQFSQDSMYDKIDEKMNAQPASQYDYTGGSTSQLQVGYGTGATGSVDCTPNPAAAAVGIKHYRFPEASSSDLVDVNGYKVHRDMAGKLREMMAAARAAGAPLTLGSAFRSVSYQQGIVNRKKSAGQSAYQIYHMSAPAGYSEHHTGFAVDFSPINSGFARTAGYRWLLNNASRYGFQQTYTAAYSAKSGVSEESWHWKYVASPSAQAALANQACY